MTKVELLTLSLVVVVVLVLIIFDVQQLVVTPLTPYGVNHWIPEFLTLICFGYIAVKYSNVIISIIIAGCILLYPILTYYVLNITLAFGTGTGTFFTAAFVMGMWLGHKREEEK